MEIKINKEIRTYKETIFFGLSLRQFVCAVLAVGVAVGLYFALRNVLDRETVSWVCIVGAAPIAVAGFFKYNGMTLEKFLWAWLKSEFLMAGNRVWKAENYYLSALGKEDKKR
ncbi:MAG: PrgI family protein [Oscillospiraceae bacterium]|nr:PrgI family protein [Oscillospiraceae bacterium]